MNLLRCFAAALAAIALDAHAVGELADVRIVDRASGRELPVYWHEGQAYVVGRPGNEYRIDLRNRRGEDVLAVVSVDGVNVLSGESASPSQGGYVLSAWERTDIRGWRKSLGEVAAFYFTSLGDSYAARTGRPADVGVIGVALFQRRAPMPPPIASNIGPGEPELRREKSAVGSGLPAEDRAAKRSGAPATPQSAAPPSAPLGTGHGRRETSHATYVPFDRATAAPVEVIAIRYDSYRNLAARGIVPAYGQRRDPDPFPSRFVPDPD